MIKRKRYLVNHKPGARSPVTPARGDKCTIAALEADLAESESVVRGLEAQLKASEAKEESNSENEALVHYGHTRTPTKKRG